MKLRTGPTWRMMRAIRKDTVAAANDGGPGDLIEMDVRRLLHASAYAKRSEFLSWVVGENGDPAITAYYRSQARRRGETMAAAKCAKYAQLCRTMARDWQSDRAHAPVVVVDDGDFVRRLDGTHRISILRWLGHERIPVVAIEQDEYVERCLGAFPRAEVERLVGSHRNWYQAIEVLPGLWTWPFRPRKEGLMCYVLGELDLAGARVLDVGCNSGLYSFRAGEAGAASVLGVDKRPHAIEQADLVQGVWGVTHPGSEIAHFEVGNMLEGDWLDRLGEFDTVIAACVLYHLRSPGLRLFLEAAALGGVRRFIVQGNHRRCVNLNPAKVAEVEASGIRADTPANYICTVAAFRALFAHFGYRDAGYNFGDRGQWPVVVFEGNAR